MNNDRKKAIEIVEQAKKDCFWSMNFDAIAKLDRVIAALRFDRKWWRQGSGKWLNLETGETR